jgi:hypothetical protein
MHAGVDVRPAANRSVRASAAGRVAATWRADAAVVRGRSFEANGIVSIDPDPDGDPATRDDRLQTIHQNVEPMVVAGEIVVARPPERSLSAVPGR